MVDHPDDPGDGERPRPPGTSTVLAGGMVVCGRDRSPKSAASTSTTAPSSRVKVAQIIGGGWLQPHLQVVLKAPRESFGRACRTNADVNDDVHVEGDPMGAHTCFMQMQVHHEAACEHPPRQVGVREVKHDVPGELVDAEAQGAEARSWPRRERGGGGDRL